LLLVVLSAFTGGFGRWVALIVTIVCTFLGLFVWECTQTAFKMKVALHLNSHSKWHVTEANVETELKHKHCDHGKHKWPDGVV
jgi:hypothetical protein